MGREQRKPLIIKESLMIKEASKRSLSLMINDYGSRRNKKGYTPELAQRKAEYLCAKLKSPQSARFYLKCTWNLTDAYIDGLLNLSLRKAEPARYFAVVAAKEMR